jgi:hypothetical protein
MAEIKFGRKNINWDDAREIFIRGTQNENGAPVDYSFQNIADKLGVSKQAVWKRSQKDGWEDKRSLYKQQLFLEEKKFEEAIRSELRKANLPTYSTFLSQTGRMCYILVGNYIKLLTDDTKPLRASFSDVLLAVEKLEHILNFLEGRENLLEDVVVDFSWRALILNLANLPERG